MEVNKRKDVPGLPPGWSREECVRQSGLSSGRTDVYYVSPDGIKIRSKPALSRYLGENFDLSVFDYRSGRIVSSALRKSKRQKGTSYDYARGIRHDANLTLPIRQTASIFKQPVTVIKRKDSSTKADLKHGPQDPPRQLFWEKRLQGMKAFDHTEELIQSLELPKNMTGAGPDLTTENILQSISAALHVGTVPIIGQHSNKSAITKNPGAGPDLTTENILQSISAALHVGTVPIIGQHSNKSAITKNPGVHIDINQPHIQQLIVSDDDIRRQEARVLEARKKLQEMLTD